MTLRCSFFTKGTQILTSTDLLMRSPPRRTPTPPPKSHFQFIQHIKHQPLSLQSTPRVFSQTPRAAADYDGVPEGLLATEGGGLSASFSLAPPRSSDERAPLISALEMMQCDQPRDGSSFSSVCLCVADGLGRIDHLETRSAQHNPKMFRKHSHQAFVGEFDCLTSLVVDEKITCVRYLHANRAPGVVSYLAANEKTIKLFRVRHDNPGNYLSQFPLGANNGPLGMSAPSTGSLSPALSLPTPRVQKRIVMPHRVFTGPHKSPLQDLSVCADGETFMSVDDLQIYWWALESSDPSRATCIVDLTPLSGRMEDVSQLITTAGFHPSHGSLFFMGRSNGLVSVGDLRDPPSRKPRTFGVNIQLQSSHNTVQHDEHNDILTSISSAAFLGDNFVVTRDFLELKLWDMRNPGSPVAKQGVMNWLEPHLNKLYDSDAIFDRFKLTVDHETCTVVSGAYGGIVGVWQPHSRDEIEYYSTDPYTTPDEAENGGRVSSSTVLAKFSAGLSDADRDNKVTHTAIAPGGSRLCCCTSDHLFVFARKCDANSTV